MTVTEDRLDYAPAPLADAGPARPPSTTRRGLSPLRRLLRGRAGDPSWVRPALIALLAGAAVLYLVDLSHSGYANDFYSAAVQAGTKSWEAFFFGSSDAANFITVDKPPGALWVMEISARLFGLSPWSVLAPQAVEGVASVWLLYLTMRRGFSAGIALAAGGLLAITPVAALIFRYNNPDALLVLVLLGATYATLRAVESGRSWWLILSALLVGYGFNTKLLQAVIVVPVLAAVYLVAGPPALRKRLLQLAAAGVALAVSASWWVVTVQLIPAADRPYVGGSQDDSLLNVIFGYNGLGRLSGSEAGVMGFNNTASAGAGPAGWLRLFDVEFRSQIGWFLPAALIALAAGLWLTRRSPRTDARRAALLVWGGSLVITGLTFSLGQGIIHTYYSVALAPAVAALVAAGGGLLWARRHDRRARRTLALMAVATIGWGEWILTKEAPWSTPGAVLGTLIFVSPGAALAGRIWGRPVARAVVALTLLFGLVGPLVYDLGTVVAEHHSALPTAGFEKSQPGQWARIHVTRSAGSFAVGSSPSPALTAVLAADARRYTWVAATVGSERAAGYQLAAGQPVMAVGGFNGTDPTPSLAVFRRYVAAGRIHYFVDGGMPWKKGSKVLDELRGDAAAVTAWVERTYPARSIDGVKLYDLAGPKLVS